MTAGCAPGEADELGRQARAAADAVLATLGGLVDVAVHPSAGEAAEKLIERSPGMDLIVLGSRGYGPPRTMLFGSVSSRVVPEAHCPVMILAAPSTRTSGT